MNDARYLEILEKYEAGGYDSQKAMADELGIATSTLSRWLLRARSLKQITEQKAKEDETWKQTLDRAEKTAKAMREVLELALTTVEEYLESLTALREILSPPAPTVDAGTARESQENLTATASDVPTTATAA